MPKESKTTKNNKRKSSSLSNENDESNTFNDDIDSKENDNTDTVAVVPDDSDNNDNDSNDMDMNNSKEKDNAPKRKRKRKKKNNNKSEDTIILDNHQNIGLSIDEDTVVIPEEEKIHSLDYTVYVEGLPFDCNEDEIKEFFVSNGCQDVLQMRLPRWQDSGRLRGYGHIVFHSKESRSKSLSELNGSHLKSRYISIQIPKESSSFSSQRRNNNTNDSESERQQPREQPKGCKTIFVKNLPYHDITEEDVHSVFSSCGKIIEGGVRFARNYETKQFKGFAYIEFKNPEGAYEAVTRASTKVGRQEHNQGGGGVGGGIVVKGRTCFVDYDEGYVRNSFRTKDGKFWKKEFGGGGRRGGNGSRGRGDDGFRSRQGRGHVGRV